MEDSYTVHRRRKAAAKKREKTPEPSTRSHLVETDDDEEEARRARMQLMAEDAEKHELEMNRVKLEEQREEEPKNGRKSQDRAPVVVPERRKSSHSGEETVRKSFVEAGPRDVDISDKVVELRSPKREVIKSEALVEPIRADVKVDSGAREKIRESYPRSKEVDDDNGKVSEVKKEKRIKKRSKERSDKYPRSTDSSDDEGQRSPRRTKSPETSRIRVKKSTPKPKSGDSEIVSRKEASEKPSREMRLSSKKLEDSEASSKEKSERKHSRRHSQTDDTEEGIRMRKSDTFPPRSMEEPILKRSVSDVKKQIIPISDDSLIEDFEKAQRNYLMREHSILEPDPADILQDSEGQSSLRRRKFSTTYSESEHEEVKRLIEEAKEPEKKGKSWFSWLSFFRRKKVEKADDDAKEKDDEVVQEKIAPLIEKVQEVKQPSEKVTLMDFFRALRDIVAEFRAFMVQNPRQIAVINDLRNRCAAEMILMIIYCGLGAFVFRFTEGAFESFYKCGVKRVKRDFLDSLWNYSHNLREDDWKSMARKKLMDFEEQLHAAHEAGVHTYSGQRSWTFLNAVVYCLTVITTIGYGHISPSTTTGRAITIVYAIFGIPMFLIILADFGKLFTRCIKFFWAFVRRLYYTGSCRKVRRTAPVQEVMKGVQLVYDLATFRRPSQMNPEDIEEMQRQAQQQQQQTVLNLDGNVPDTPGTPAMSNFAIDDEFNLPISVAIVILIGYIFVGATLYYMWEDWGFFESFYFVFISMSTIGFGDYVPKHPIYMMCSIIYLVFGLALTSMCINVVQVKLSDSFKQATHKIGATIGFEVAEDDGSIKPAVPTPVEVADVHMSMKESNSGEKIAPKAKQEDIDL